MFGERETPIHSAPSVFMLIHSPFDAHSFLLYPLSHIEDQGPEGKVGSLIVKGKLVGLTQRIEPEAHHSLQEETRGKTGQTLNPRHSASLWVFASLHFSCDRTLASIMNYVYHSHKLSSAPFQSGG